MKTEQISLYKLHTITTLLLVCVMGLAHAESTGTDAQQQELNKALEMMKGSGLDPKQMKQIEGMMQGMVNEDAERKSAQLEKEQKEFAAATANSGTARIDVEGSTYNLNVTECKVVDQSTGIFNLVARQAPGNDNGHLTVNGGGTRFQSTVIFSIGHLTYDSDHTAFKFDGERLKWEGLVSSNSGQVPLKLDLNCSAGS
jgi:hypothetical protein